MAQEGNALETRNTVNNTAGGFFGGLLTGLGNLVTSAAPVATDLYTLKLQGDVLKNQNASQPSAASKPSVPSQPSGTAEGSALPAWLKPWMIWTGVGVLALGLVMMLFRRPSR